MLQGAPAARSKDHSLSFLPLPQPEMSAPGSHSVDALPVHQLRDRNGYLDAVGSAGRTDDYLGTSLEDSVQMVPLDFDSDTSSPEGLKEDQRQLGSTPTFGT